jgi:hypothetical protein
MQYFLLLCNNSGHMNIPECYVYTNIACLVPLCTSWVTVGGLYCLCVPWLWSSFVTVPRLLFVFIDLFLFKMCLFISDIAMCGARVQN